MSSEEDATDNNANGGDDNGTSDGDAAWVDLSGLPDTVVSAITALAEQARSASFTGGVPGVPG